MLIGICDDDEKNMTLLEASIKRLYPDHEIRTYASSEALLEDTNDGVRFDALLLDIIMPGITGTELAKEIKKCAADTAIAFITSSEEYAIEAFSVNALHYIVKPITDEKLDECMNRIVKEKAVKRQSIRIKSGRNDSLLYLDEILYCETRNHYVYLSLTNGEAVKAYYSIAEIKALLGDSFLTLSRGFIVNINHIRQLKARSCILKDGREILLSRNNLKEIHAAFDAYAFKLLLDEP